MRLGPTYFIPNFQIGSFGAITPFTQMIKVGIGCQWSRCCVRW